MVQKVEITGEHFAIDDSLRKYITKKLGRLDRYMHKHSRASAHLDVRLKEQKNKGQKLCVLNATLHLPHETINIKESTLNMYAAVDIVQVKLKQRIQKYKDLHATGKQHRRLFARARSGVSV